MPNAAPLSGALVIDSQDRLTRAEWAAYTAGETRLLRQAGMSREERITMLLTELDAALRELCVPPAAVSVLVEEVRATGPADARVNVAEEVVSYVRFMPGNRAVLEFAVAGICRAAGGSPP